MPGPWAGTWVLFHLSAALNPMAPTLTEGRAVSVMAVGVPEGSFYRGAGGFSGWEFGGGGGVVMVVESGCSETTER